MVSNNINETALVLGIEAARNVIVKEALGVLEEQGLDVDVRHVMLVADMMTSSGDVLQVGRHGVSGEKASTLAKAAFEITIPTIVGAAVKGITDTLSGVADNVIVGQQIPMGTGLIEVSMMMPREGGKEALVDLNKQIRRAVQTGKVGIGREAELVNRAIARARRM